MSWLRKLVDLVLGAIRRWLAPPKERRKGQPVGVAEQKKEGIELRQPPRFVLSSRGGPNAPKRYPCQNKIGQSGIHHKMLKRTKKTARTAEYYCPVCKVTTIISLR